MNHTYKLLFLLFLSSFTSFSQNGKITQRFGIGDGLENLSVFKLTQDSLGQLWIGGATRLQVYDGNEFRSIEGPTGRVMFLEQIDSAIYCGTAQSLYQINLYGKVLKQIKYPRFGYHTLHFKDHQFQLKLKDTNAVYTADTTLTTWSESSFQFKEDNSWIDQEHHLAHDNVYVYNIGGDTLLQSDLIQFVKIHGDDLYIGISDGLLKYKWRDWKAPPDTICKVETQDMLFDKAGNLWLATAYDGVFLLHRNAVFIQEFPMLDNGNTFPCWSVFTYQNSVLSANRYGVTILEGEDNLSWTSEVHGEHCTAGIQLGNTVYIGTIEGQLYGFRGKERLRQLPSDTSLSTIFQLLRFKNYVVSVSREGLQVLDSMLNTVQILSNKDLNLVGSEVPLSAVAYKNNLYISTMKGIVIVNRNFELVKEIKFDESRICLGSGVYNNAVWTSIYDEGVYRISESGFSSPIVLNKIVYSLQGSETGLWFAAATELLCYNGNEVFSPLPPGTGCVYDYGQNSTLETENFIWFGGAGGYNKINKHIANFHTPYPVLLLSYANGTPLHAKSYSPSSNTTLHIRPVSITDRDLFSHYIIHDNDTIQIEGASYISLQLSEGQNEFKICSQYRVTGEIVFTNYSITVPIPLYKRWYTYLAGLIVISFIPWGIIAILKSSKRKKLLKIERVENRIKDERLRISHELHDNVGSRMAHIISSLDIETYQQKEEKQKLTQLTEFARETMLELRESIWSIGDKNVTLLELISRFERRVREYTDSVDVEFDLLVQELPDFALSSTTAINLSRVLREALGNTIRHSKATRIELVVSSSASLVSIHFKDNGIGFSDKDLLYRAGLSTMYDRAKEGEFDLFINSLKNQTGTTITIHINRNRSNAL